MRWEHEIRRHLSDAIEARRGIIIVFQPSFQLVISALKWCLGEGKKDNAVPGFGKPRGENEIRARLLECQNRQTNSIKILAQNWKIIVASLEWVLGDSDLTPLEARGQIKDRMLFG